MWLLPLVVVVVVDEVVSCCGCVCSLWLRLLVVVVVYEQQHSKTLLSWRLRDHLTLFYKDTGRTDGTSWHLLQTTLLHI